MTFIKESLSSKNKYVKIISERGPILSIIEKLEAFNFFIARETKKDGIKVDTIVIKSPKT